jgi:fermentation-respiration switch protein FrsA (DUF1100 family)
MVIVENGKIENIPLLHVVRQRERLEKLPLVIFIHGFKSVKERNLHYGYLLAEAGFRVLMPEVLYHGERDEGLSDKELYIRFWEMVLNTINEINRLKESYVKKGIVDAQRIGLAGTSMGGIVTLGALTQYKWIKTAVSLMGMPSYEDFSMWQLEQLRTQGVNLPFTAEQIEQQLQTLREYDLSGQPEKLANRPLLFWHGKKDPLVPYDLTFQFFESTKPAYQGNPEKLQFITDQRAGHNVSLEGVEATVQWFNNYLQ